MSDTNDELLGMAVNMAMNIGHNTEFSTKPLNALIVAYIEQQAATEDKDKRIAEIEADKAELLDALLDARSYTCMPYPEYTLEYEDDIALIDELIAKHQQPPKEQGS